MTELLDFKGLLTLASQIGFPGIVLVLWYMSDKSHREALQSYREDMLRQQAASDRRVEEVREMYANNVELVKVTQQYAGDYKDVLLMVCGGLQGMKDAIETNQYCPNVRLTTRKTQGGYPE